MNFWWKLFLEFLNFFFFKFFIFCVTGSLEELEKKYKFIINLFENWFTFTLKFDEKWNHGRKKFNRDPFTLCNQQKLNICARGMLIKLNIFFFTSLIKRPEREAAQRKWEILIGTLEGGKSYNTRAQKKSVVLPSAGGVKFIRNETKKKKLKYFMRRKIQSNFTSRKMVSAQTH